MNLQQIRRQFVETSGRYDLVSEDGTDNGANFFINAGVRFLERQGDFETGQIYTTNIALAANANSFIVQNCWDVLSVGMRVDNNSIVYLTRMMSAYTFKNMFGTCIHIEGCAPYTFFTEPVREIGLATKAAKDISLSVELFTSTEASYKDTISGTKISLTPVPTQSLNLVVKGHFTTPPLTQDSDTNIWSDDYPDLLLKASLYELEVFYRNSEGAKDWLEAVQIDMRSIEQQQILSYIRGKDTMGD